MTDEGKPVHHHVTVSVRDDRMNGSATGQEV
jgi:hypothetical protein